MCAQQSTKKGFVETVRVTYDPSVLPLPSLLAAYDSVRVPSPTRQYKSVVFASSSSEAAAVEKWRSASPTRNGITVEPLGDFFLAETYHQNYYGKWKPRAFVLLALLVGAGSSEGLVHDVCTGGYALGVAGALGERFLGGEVKRVEKGVCSMADSMADSMAEGGEASGGRGEEEGGGEGRRNFLVAAAVLPASGFGFYAAEEAAAIAPPPPPLDSSPTSLSSLSSRATDRTLVSPPTFGLSRKDIFYPPWFAGTWSVTSVATAAAAPCGVQFIGNNTYAKAIAEVAAGEKGALKYKCRFVGAGESGGGAGGEGEAVVADREYNTKSIAGAAMGDLSVVSFGQDGANKVKATLAPAAAKGTVFDVEILTMARSQEGEEGTFVCSELGRNVFAATRRGEDGQKVKTVTLKDIETISSYTLVSDGVIKGTQRSLSYLVPGDDPGSVQYRMWRLSRGNAVDERVYDVEYRRL